MLPRALTLPRAGAGGTSITLNRTRGVLALPSLHQHQLLLSTKSGSVYRTQLPPVIVGRRYEALRRYTSEAIATAEVEGEAVMVEKLGDTAEKGDTTMVMSTESADITTISPTSAESNTPSTPTAIPWAQSRLKYDRSTWTQAMVDEAVAVRAHERKLRKSWIYGLKTIEQGFKKSQNAFFNDIPKKYLLHVLGGEEGYNQKLEEYKNGDKIAAEKRKAEKGKPMEKKVEVKLTEEERELKKAKRDRHRAKRKERLEMRKAEREAQRAIRGEDGENVGVQSMPPNRSSGNKPKKLVTGQQKREMSTTAAPTTNLLTAEQHRGVTKAEERRKAHESLLKLQTQLVEDRSLHNKKLQDKISQAKNHIELLQIHEESRAEWGARMKEHERQLGVLTAEREKFKQSQEHGKAEEKSSQNGKAVRKRKKKRGGRRLRARRERRERRERMREKEGEKKTEKEGEQKREKNLKRREKRAVELQNGIKLREIKRLRWMLERLENHLVTKTSWWKDTYEQALENWDVEKGDAKNPNKLYIRRNADGVVPELDVKVMWVAHGRKGNEAKLRESRDKTWEANGRVVVEDLNAELPLEDEEARRVQLAKAMYQYYRTPEPHVLKPLLTIEGAEENVRLRRERLAAWELAFEEQKRREVENSVKVIGQEAGETVMEAVIPEEMVQEDVAEKVFQVSEAGEDELKAQEVEAEELNTEDVKEVEVDEVNKEETHAVGLIAEMVEIEIPTTAEEVVNNEATEATEMELPIEEDLITHENTAEVTETEREALVEELAKEEVELVPEVEQAEEAEPAEEFVQQETSQEQEQVTEPATAEEITALEVPETETISPGEVKELEEATEETEVEQKEEAEVEQKEEAEVEQKEEENAEKAEEVKEMEDTTEETEVEQKEEAEVEQKEEEKAEKAEEVKEMEDTTEETEVEQKEEKAEEVKESDSHPISETAETPAPPTEEKEKPVSTDFYSLLLNNPITYAATTSTTTTPAAAQSPSTAFPTTPTSAPTTGTITFSTTRGGSATGVSAEGGAVGIEKAQDGTGKPIEPDNCCMSGCVNCVWDLYREELEEWVARQEREKVERVETVGDVEKVEGVEETQTQKERQKETEWIGNEEIPVGIRAFMAMEKRLRERKAG